MNYASIENRASKHIGQKIYIKHFKILPIKIKKKTIFQRFLQLNSSFQKSNFDQKIIKKILFLLKNYNFQEILYFIKNSHLKKSTTQS